MSAVLLADILERRVMPFVIGCPIETAEVTLIDLVREFCNFTRCYQFEVEDETILAHINEYDVEVSDTTVVEPIAIEAMTVDGAPCYPKDVRWFERFLGANWKTRDSDDFRYFTQLQPKTFHFPGVPTKNGTAGGLHYRVSQRPKQDAVSIDSLQVDEWGDAWAAGVLWKLKGMGGNPAPRWYDPKGADDKRKEYISMRGAARIRVNLSYGSGQLRAVGDKFA